MHPLMNPLKIVYLVSNVITIIHKFKHQLYKLNPLNIYILNINDLKNSSINENLAYQIILNAQNNFIYTKHYSYLKLLAYLLQNINPVGLSLLSIYSHDFIYSWGYGLFIYAQ